MSRYAETTAVPADKSRAEIERTLERYGATAFAYAWQGQNASIMFEADGRRVRFLLPLPDREAAEFTRTPGRGVPRSPEAAREAWSQACRQRWRALALVIKAKLEAVEAGITEFQDEFLAHIVLPDGRTVGDHARPGIAIAYESGTLPPLLPGPPRERSR
jgi:hypothetical protein